MLHLPTDEIHLWRLDVSEGDDQDIWRAIRLLDVAEKARMARFAFVHLQREFAATRVLCRTVLSRYVPAVAAHAWSFGINAWGRPHALLPADAPAIDFNISHSSGVIVMAVAHANRRIGVDVEAVNAARAEPGIARRFFSAAECAALEALPDTDRMDRFFELWSAKESYVKARGLGLSMPFNTFSVAFSAALDGAGCHARLVEVPPDDHAGLWQLLLPDCPPRHKLALCARRMGPGDAVGLRHFEFALPV